MCRFKSGIILKDRVRIAEGANDRHTDLLREMGLGDDFIGASRTFVRAELVPLGNKWWIPPEEHPESWEFIVDQDITPEWFDKTEYEKMFREAVIGWWKKHVLVDQKIDKLSSGYYRLKHCEVNGLCKDAQVMLDDSIVRKMYNNSVVQWMLDDSIVQEMHNDSIVQEMYDSSTVQRMYNRSTVREMYGSSTVQWMSDNSIVQEMYSDSTVQEMYGASTVRKMCNDSVVRKMYNNSVVQWMLDDSMVQKMYNASIARSYQQYPKIQIFVPSGGPNRFEIVYK